jgi:hypothetical protein
MRRRHLGAAVIGLLMAVMTASVALADGLPRPLEGVSDGPEGATLKDTVEGFGLGCQPDTGVNGLPEWSCTRADAGGPSTLSAAFYAEPALVLQAFAYTTDPAATEPAMFVTSVAQPFCTERGPVAVASFISAVVAGAPSATEHVFEDATCRLQVTYAGGSGATDLVVLAYSKWGTGGGEPVSGSDTPGGNTGGEGRPGVFARSIATPAEVSRDPLVLAEGVALAVAIVFLMPFPAQLFNSTLEEHWDEVRRWIGIDRIAGASWGLTNLWNRPAGVVLFVAISALLYAMLDPSVGFSMDSLAELLGLGLGMVVTTVAFATPAILAHRRGGDSWRLRALPGTLLVGIGCVLVSRLTDFQPGYLYGLIIGVQFGRDLASAEEGRETAMSAVVMLLAAAAAWFGLSLFGAGDPGVLGLALQTALAATMVAGLEGVVFGLLPLRFLPGEPLYAWNRMTWAVLLGIGVFAFLHILVNPSSGYLSDSSRTPLFTIAALFIAFAVVSVAFWGYFRFRRPRETGA